MKSRRCEMIPSAQTGQSAEVERLRKTYKAYREAGIDGRWSSENPGNREMVRERHEATGLLFQEHHLLPLAGRRVLDVGCGSGGELAQLLRWGADAGGLLGVDLLPERVEAARAAHPELSFCCGNAETLDFPDGAFDLVLLFTVLSSILDPAMARNLCGEVMRVVKPGGAVLCYDFRFDNPYNRNVRGVRRKELVQLFPGFSVQARSLTLMPPLARRLGRWTGAIYPLLSRVPFLRTHNLTFLQKIGSPSP